MPANTELQTQRHNEADRMRATYQNNKVYSRLFLTWGLKQNNVGRVTLIKRYFCADHRPAGYLPHVTGMGLW